MNYFANKLSFNHLNLSRRSAVVLFMAALTAVRTLLQCQLYRQGFISVSADEFARGLRAFAWSERLRINPLADLISPWPPFEMYLNGLAIRLIGDPLVAPRITVFIASCFLLLVLFALVERLFQSWVTAALSVLFVAAQPWFIWLSGTPMLEIYFLACFIGGLYFLIVWLQEKSGRGWLYAGLLFFLASGFHVQSWAQINLVNLFTLYFLFQFFKRRQFTQVARLLLFWIISNSFILFNGVAEYFATGQLFGILASHTSYSLWYYGGYDVPVSEKLFYFPRIVWRGIPLWGWIAAGVGLFLIFLGESRPSKLLFLALGAVTLTLASLFNLASGPPSAAPDRYALFYLILLAPYAAYGFYQLAVCGRRPVETKEYGWIMALAALFVVLLLQDARAANQFPRGMANDTVETGRWLRQATNEQDLLPRGKMILLEARYWDFLALELMIGDNDKLLYDREHDYLNRENPSRLLEEAEAVENWLTAGQVSLAAWRDPVLKERADNLPFLIRLQNVGEWAIYRFAPSSSL
jgi:4-amino-4-deoxy-L-arabinose transferase-like glycosyltransferase